jgi:hypothetical protein
MLDDVASVLSSERTDGKRAGSCGSNCERDRTDVDIAAASPFRLIVECEQDFNRTVVGEEDTIVWLIRLGGATAAVSSLSDGSGRAA